MKHTFLFLMLLLVTQAHANNSFLCDIAKKTDGTLQSFNFKEAEQYCKASGARLPTIREFAIYSDARSTYGLKETGQPGVSINDQAVKAEIEYMRWHYWGPSADPVRGRNAYNVVYQKNVLGEITVAFYFTAMGWVSDYWGDPVNHAGYRKPQGDAGKHYFWSSSVHPFQGPPPINNTYHYIFNGAKGGITNSDDVTKGVATCCIQK